MYAAQELDHDGAGSGLFSAALAESPACQQDTEARAGVGINQEEHALPYLRRLLDAQRGHDAVVHRIVEEQHLGGVYQHGQQRIQLVGEHPVHTRGEAAGNPRNRVADHHVSRDCKQHRDDTEGEVVHQHFEAGAHLSLDQFVETLYAPSGDRSHYHCSEEHRSIGTDYHAHGGNCACHSPSVAADVLACRKGYQRG